MRIGKILRLAALTFALAMAVTTALVEYADAGRGGGRGGGGMRGHGGGGIVVCEAAVEVVTMVVVEVVTMVVVEVVTTAVVIAVVAIKEAVVAIIAAERTRAKRFGSREL